MAHYILFNLEDALIEVLCHRISVCWLKLCLQGFPAFLRDALQMQRPIFHRTLSIVSSQRSNMSLRWILLVVFWLVSLALTWGASHSVVPHLAETEAQLRQSRQIQASQTHQIQKLQQRQINLEISDQISRAANARYPIIACRT